MNLTIRWMKPHSVVVNRLGPGHRLKQSLLEASENGQGKILRILKLVSVEMAVYRVMERE